MIQAIINLQEEVRELREQILRLERLVLANHPDCEECQQATFEIVAALHKEHYKEVAAMDVHVNGEEEPSGDRGD